MVGTGVAHGGRGSSHPEGLRRAAGRAGPSALILATVVLALAGCGLHVSKHGVSGNILGHNFSAESGSLPAGFPSDVPLPDHSRVLGGGGADNRWDAAFAVTGNVTNGTVGYEDKFRSAGFTITNAETGAAPTPSSGAAGGVTSTTVTVDGGVFTAHDDQWTVEVVGGSTTAPTTGALKPGEFAINVTVVPTSSIPTTAAG